MNSEPNQDSSQNPWELVLNQIRSQNLVESFVVEQWLAKMLYLSFAGGVLRLEAASEWYCQTINSRFSSVIGEVAKSIWPNFQSLELVAQTQNAPIQAGLISPATPMFKICPHQNGQRRHGRFKTFVRCSANQLAYAAIGQVVKEIKQGSPSSYPFIFLFGKSGLGKTHLLEAVYNYLSQDSQRKVILISAENFLNEMVAANFSKHQVAFRQRYRQADVFLLDEAHFANNRRLALQEELKRTFDDLAQRQAQVIVASTLPTEEMQDSNPELLSRFRGGLTIKLDLPDQEARMAIAKQIANQAGMAMPEDVAQYLATSADADVRQLVGAVTKVLALNRLLDQPIDLETAAQGIECAVAKKVKLTLERIGQAVAEYFELKVSDLRRNSRVREIVYPRQIGMYLCAKLLDSNYTNIAKFFGKKDHSTVIYSCKVIEGDFLAQKDVLMIKEKLGL